MAKLIALEWDAREARVVVANPRGGDLVVDDAFAIDLSGASPSETISDQLIGQRLAAEFAARGLGGSDALVALSRSSIELRTLNLPVAPPDEIPDLVRFQAMQAFTTIGEDWPLDYVEMEGHDDSLSVLAAVVSPKEVQQVGDICTAAGVKATCLVLRPFAAVSLLQRDASIDLQRGSLIVDLLPDGADLTAVSHGQVVFMRSVRLPSHADDQAQARALVGELRRTIGAAQNQMGGGQIEQIIICDVAEEHAVLRQAVAESMPQEVIAFDPFDAVRAGRGLKSSFPEHAGRYAPLLGMLACELSGTRHTIDFLNPRKRPAPPSNKRRNLVAAAATLSIVVAGAAVFTLLKNNLDAEIAQLQTQSKELDAEVDKAKVLIDKANAVKKFADGDVTWLDELHELANRLPDADHVILDKLTVAVDPEKGGRMSLQGHVVRPDVIAKFEDSLRYGDNVVAGKKGIVDEKRKDYPYLLETTIVVPPDVQKDGHSVGRPPSQPKQESEQVDTTAAETSAQKGTSTGPPAEAAKADDQDPPDAPATDEMDATQEPVNAVSSASSGEIAAPTPSPQPSSTDNASEGANETPADDSTPTPESTGPTPDGTAPDGTAPDGAAAEPAETTAPTPPKDDQPQESPEAGSQIS